MLLSATLLSGMTSCGSDDPDYGTVTPPVIAQSHNISGSIAGMDGKAISGATVTMSGSASATVTTDANGYFVFGNVGTGTYTLKATAPGKLPKETSVKVAESEGGKIVVWNVMLASEAAVTTVSVGVSGGEGDIVTEALEGNDKAEIPVEVSVPASALNKTAQINVSPIYSESEVEAARSSRAIESTLVVGARLSCSDNTVRIEHAIDIAFDVDDVTTSEVKAQKYTNNGWVDVPSRIEGNKVIVSADEFTSYGLFADINFTVSSVNTPLTFDRNIWNNLNGNGMMLVGSAAYTYMVGMDIATSGTTVFTALLIETLARQFGANSFEVSAVYPMDIMLPEGTILQVNGVQKVNTVTASVGSRSVSGTQYGDVTISTVVSSRDHTGGSNRPGM